MPAPSALPIVPFTVPTEPPEFTPSAAVVLLRILRKEHERATSAPRREAA
ncbi:MAG: hypothetical protein MUF83_10875 [Acidimicrobiales bacterium]|jgi:hypothetical protein|nr:hypothetical protein [Acidimicrobiales bacterium]MCU0272961.1 hypothetical protein [Acidimicrobiales bacterium]